MAPGFAADEANLRGTVVDPKGNPADGQVTVYDASGNPVAFDYAYGGRIAATIPTTGDFRVEFRPSSGDLQNEFYLDQPTLAAASVVSAAGGTAQMAPWTIDYAPYVTGVVTDAAGTPIEQASVQVFDATSKSWEASDYTEFDGTFHVPVRDGGDVKVQISAGDFAAEWFNDKTDIDAADVVTPTAAGTNLGSVVLTKGATISGRVTSDAGAPLELVEVRAVNTATGFSRFDRTDANGAYTVEGLPAGGTYRLEAVDSTLGEYEGEYYNDTTDSSAAQPVSVAKDQAVTGIDFGLAPAELEPVTGIDLTGKVVDETGKPVVGVDVTAFSTPANLDDERTLGWAVTNRQGVYQFTELDGVADDAVKVYADGFSPREKDAFGVSGRYLGNVESVEAATAVATSSLPRTGADIALVSQGGASGKIASDTGSRLKWAWVSLYDEDGDYVDNLNVKSDGTFKATDVEPGTYTVQFGANEHISEFWNNTVQGKATKVTITSKGLVSGLDAVLTQTLVAVDRPTIAGDPLVGATLTAAPGTWNRMADTTFTYEWLADGVPVGYGNTLAVGAPLLGKTLAVRVSGVTDGGDKVFRGQAVTASTSAVQAASTTKAKAKKGKVKVAVTAGAVAATQVDGKVIVKLQVTKKKLVKVAAGTVKDGKATLKIAKLMKSKKLRKQLAKLSPKKLKKAKVAFVFDGANFVESQDVVKFSKILKAAKAKKGKKGKK